MEPFEILDHTADALVRIHGRSLDELFANAALAMASIIAEPERARPLHERRVELAEDGPLTLLTAWLSELLFLFETEELYFRDFACRVEGNALTATARGEPFDAERHGFKTEIKAVTQHELTLEQHDDGWTATVLFDL